MSGWDRKICVKDHCLASQDLQWSWGTDFFILTQILDSFFCSRLNTSFYIDKKTWKRFQENSEYAEMWHTWWCHFNITMRLQVDVWPAWGYSFFPTGLNGVCKIEFSIVSKNSINPDLVCHYLPFHQWYQDHCCWAGAPSVCNRSCSWAGPLYLQHHLVQRHCHSGLTPLAVLQLQSLQLQDVSEKQTQV